MIGHTTSSTSFNALTRPVLAIDHIASLSHDTPQLYSEQDHELSNLSHLAVEPLTETNQLLSRASHAQSSGVFDDEHTVSDVADSVVESSQEAQALNTKAEKHALAQEQDEISQLAARDREVRAHEQAHAAVGGQYAGAPTYSFQRGPDGVRYAVGGEVSIDTSKAATPEETIRKAQVVRQAALAPAEPSPQDRRVAAEASQIQAQAVQELRSQQIEEKKQEQEAKADSNDDTRDEVSGSNAEGRQAGLLLDSSASVDSVDSVSRDKVSDDKTIHTDFTSTRHNIIGSRIYQSIANLAISHRDNYSILDQII